MSLTEQDIQALMAKGVDALNAGDLATARAALEQVAASGRADRDAWFALAIARHALKDLPATHGALDQVLAIEPQNIRALLMKADCFAEAGDGRAAASFYAMVTKLAPPPDTLPPDIAAEIRRAKEALDRISGTMLDHLRSELASVGYDETASSARFTESLQMLAGVKQRYIEEPANFYFSGLTAVEFFPRDMFGWAPALEAATDDIDRELNDYIADGDVFEPYVVGEANRPQRTHKLMNSLDWSAIYLIRDGRVEEETAARFPKTMAALKHASLDTIEGRAPIALFSRLTPGTRLDPHTGYLNSRAICHLPIIVPGQCFLRVGNTVHEWKRGELCVLNDTIEHEAWNNSSADRIVLLFSIWRPELTEEERRLTAALIRAAVTFPSGG